MLKTFIRIILPTIVITIFLYILSTDIVKAQTDEIEWTNPINISNSPDSTSTDPFLLADPAGIIHLFWAEKIGFGIGLGADTIMYAYWDGITWSQPIDIFFSPEEEGNPTAIFPRAVIDEAGKIHLIWMTQPFSPRYGIKYSSVNAWETQSVQSWKTPLELSDDLTGQKYSFDIAYQPNQGLHVIFARGASEFQNKSVSYIRSMDGGETWSEPIDIYVIPTLGRGASDTRLLLEAPNRIYASWTEYDNTGNGQAVYFTRSLDNGLTWDKPIPLAVRIGDEYERDWNNMSLIGEGQIVSIWEGGYRAYRGAMYSYDMGASWTEPDDVFPWLIGDNGSVEFASDGKGTLHVFIANRIREGNPDREGAGLWHSIWEGGTYWREPNLATIATVDGSAERMTNPKVAVVNGNQIVAAWYQSHIYEIYVMSGTITNAPYVPSVQWIEPSHSQLLSTPLPTLAPNLEVNSNLTDLTNKDLFNDVGSHSITNPGSNIIFGVIIPLILVLSFTFVQLFKRLKLK